MSASVSLHGRQNTISVGRRLFFIEARFLLELVDISIAAEVQIEVAAPSHHAWDPGLEHLELMAELRGKRIIQKFHRFYKELIRGARLRVHRVLMLKTDLLQSTLLEDTVADAEDVRPTVLPVKFPEGLQHRALLLLDVHMCDHGPLLFGREMQPLPDAVVRLDLLLGGIANLDGELPPCGSEFGEEGLHRPLNPAWLCERDTDDLPLAVGLHDECPRGIVQIVHQGLLGRVQNFMGGFAASLPIPELRLRPQPRCWKEGIVPVQEEERAPRTARASFGKHSDHIGLGNVKKIFRGAASGPGPAVAAGDGCRKRHGD
mmetsp:Transcript_34437/g.109075  ORF Transcript_34437/g.109075 Transcript_34437/m.109075 type:complete len:317 (-) Transcript_34437:170-1120(-)